MGRNWRVLHLSNGDSELTNPHNFIIYGTLYYKKTPAAR